MEDRIRVNTQSSIRIESSVGVIYLDPLQIPGEPHDADYVFITHNHGDHFSPDDIQSVSKSSTVLVVPEKMNEQAQKIGPAVGNIKMVVPGEHYQAGPLEFTTVSAYNNLKPFHPKKSGWVGYILQLDGKRIYIAGDTDVTKENKAVSCDIAMVPIGGTFTMDAAKAAELINTIKPKIAIPTHYGSIVGKLSDAETFRQRVNPEIKVVIKINS